MTNSPTSGRARQDDIYFHFKVKPAIMVSIYHTWQFSSESVTTNPFSSTITNFVDNIRNDKFSPRMLDKINSNKNLSENTDQFINKILAPNLEYWPLFSNKQVSTA